MDMSHNYYLSFYKAGLKPFNTLASLEALYKDLESHRGEWLDSASRVDFIEGQKLLIEAINYIKSTQNNNNNGGNNMNTNETKKIMIEVEVPVYENSLDEALAIIDNNNIKAELVTKKIAINSTNIIDQVIGYVDAIIRPLLDKKPNIIFSRYNGVTSTIEHVVTKTFNEHENISVTISYDEYYKTIIIRMNGSYCSRYFDILVTSKRGTYLKLNEKMNREDVALFLAEHWSILKAQLNEVIEKGTERAIDNSHKKLSKQQDRMEILNNFKL